MNKRSRNFYFDASYTSIFPSRSGATRVVERTWREAQKQGTETRVITRVREGQETFFKESQPSATTRFWPLSLLGKSLKRKQEQEVSWHAGDVLFLPDTYWAYPHIWPAVARARERGVCSVPLVYDLIPLKHPEIYGEDGAAMFRTYLQNLLSHADAIVTISQTIANELEQFLLTIKNFSSPPPILPWKLGCDLPSVEHFEKSDSNNLFKLRSPESAYLVVGSLEPRKNHCFILDVFERLWSVPETQNLRLAFVGTAGFKSEKVLQRIKMHTKNNKQLFFFSDFNDAALAHAYKGARGVVFASIAEGFGLPITEALAHGQKVFVSDLPIHREVGGADCEFFSLDNTDALFSSISKHEKCFGTTSTPHYSHTTPISWEKSASLLLELLEQCQMKTSLPSHNRA